MQKHEGSAVSYSYDKSGRSAFPKSPPLQATQTTTLKRDGGFDRVARECIHGRADCEVCLWLEMRNFAHLLWYSHDYSETRWIWQEVRALRDSLHRVLLAATVNLVSWIQPKTDCMQYVWATGW